jgi:hypothetical protein
MVMMAESARDRLRIEDPAKGTANGISPMGKSLIMGNSGRGIESGTQERRRRLNVELRNSGTELTGRFRSENRGEVRESGNELEKDGGCFLFQLS